MTKGRVVLLTLALCLCACVAIPPAVAQTGTTITGTFKTAQQQTPAQAGLKAFSYTIATNAVYGTVTFVPGAVDSAGRFIAAREVTCGGITYVPVPTVGWIKGDGVLIEAAGGVGVKQVPNSGCLPTGLATQAKISLNQSVSQPLLIPATTVFQVKTVPDQASVDWASLAVATVATPAQAAVQFQSGATVLDFEDWTCIATPANPGAGRLRVFCDSTDSHMKRKNSAGTVVDLEAGGGGGTLTVREVDLTPSVASVTTLEFLQSDGFIITDQTGGVARVALTLLDANVPDTITLSNLTQVTTRNYSDLQNRAHALVGVDHTASGLTAGQVVRATGATTFVWQALPIGDTSGDLLASRVDDGGAASTQALFSGGAGAAGFRGIVDADVPDTITASNYLLLAGGTLTGTLTLRAGAAGAGTAPAKFQAGALNTTAEAHAFEWDGSNLFVTQATGPTRKTLLYTDGNAATATALAANPTDCAANQFAISIVASGNLTCAAIADADVPDTITASNYLPLAGGTLTGTLTLRAGAAGAGTAPAKFQAGAVNTTAEAHAFEWDGSNLFVTQATGPTRKQLVYTSQTTNTTAPLGGGGDLSADRTLTCATCTTNAAALTVDQVVVGAGGNAVKILAAGGAATVLTMSGGIPTWVAPGGGTAHAILSATHTDSLAAAVVLGDIVHGNATPAWARLAGNITTTKQFLSQTGTGAVSAAPAWAAIADADVPDSITITLAATATALAANPTDCPANQFAIFIVASGNLTCAAIADADVPDTITASNYLPLAGGTLTGTVTLRAGAAGAGTAPAKFQAGALNTTAEAHAFEWDGTNLFVTQATGPTRKQLVYTSLTINTTAPLGGGGDLSADRTLTCTTCTTNAAALTVDQVVVGAAGNAVKILAAGGAATVLTMSGGIPAWVAPGGGTAHAILSATHTDTTAATVVRGDLMVGQTATPVWQRLAVGASATFLRSNATDALWAAIADADVPDTITASNYLLLAGGTLTGTVTLRAGAAGAGTAPAKFQAGAVMTAAEAHAFEWDGTNLFVTQATGPTRKTLAYTDSNITGNAATATALAANPTDCTANQFAVSIVASGNLTCAALVDADIPAAITRDSEWPSATATLTNKTLDVEGTGNVVTTLSKIWLPGASCQNATATLLWDTPTTSPAVAACITGTNTQKGVADFADAANLSLQLTLLLPADFTGAVDAKFKWLTTAITGDVVWQLATICVADAETDDPAFNTASTVTDTAKGTANQTNDASIASVTITGCAAGELLHLKLSRDSAHASDTLAATARLVGLELTLRRAQ